MLCEYNQADIKRMSIAAHKALKGELDKTLMLDRHLKEICSRSQESDSDFQGANSLYKLPYPRIIKVAPSVATMSSIINEIAGDITECEHKYKQDALELFGRKKELILSAIKPKQIITLDSPLDNGMWWGDTLKGFNIRPGLQNNDPSMPYCGFIGGNEVHAIAGGDTGEGKSVLMNACITALLYEYPPWEMTLWMNDMKMLEFGRYAGAYKCPQVKLIAATQSPDYLISAMREFNKEMNLLYSLTSVFGAQSLKGIRSYLDMYIPRNLMATDEYSQLYALGTPRQVMEADFLMQSVAKLGRAVGYHFWKTSQNFKGTMPGSVLSQFSVGFAVGCDEETSEAITGTTAAKELKKKLGYCIVNSKRATKSLEFNKEFKVAFWPDDTDEQKAGFQNFLKDVCDTGEALGVNTQMEFYNETVQKPYTSLMNDYSFVKNVSDTNPKPGQFPMLTVPLGLFMKYTGVTDNVAYFNWNCGRRQNIFINSVNIERLKYLCQLLGDVISTKRKDAANTAVIDNMELFGDFVPNFRKNLTGEFDVIGTLNAATFRSIIVKYNAACKGNGSSVSGIGFLEYLYKKQKKQKELEFLSLFGCEVFSKDEESLVDELTQIFDMPIDDEFFEENTNLKPLREFGQFGAMITDLRSFVINMKRASGDYLESYDFTPNIYWMFDPLQNEGVCPRGALSDKFVDLLALAPTVGIFFILITTDARGMKQCLLNCRNALISLPQDCMETMGLEPFVDSSGLGYMYQYVEGTSEDYFYFKEYFKTKKVK